MDEEQNILYKNKDEKSCRMKISAAFSFEGSEKECTALSILWSRVVRSSKNSLLSFRCNSISYGTTAEKLLFWLIDRGYPIEKDSTNVYVMRRKKKTP